VPKSPEKLHGPATEKNVKTGKTEKTEKPSGAKGQKGVPESVTGNTRVNVALPFSKIEVQEPSNELIELAKLVSDLVEALADWVPAEVLADIRTRVEALLGRLST
jgi:hypothetical protein